VINLPVSETGLDEKERRICLRLEQAPVRHGKGDKRRAVAGGMVDGRVPYLQSPGSHHAMNIHFMRPDAPNGFQNKELDLSGLLSDSPGTNGGKHAHMEAILYMLQGEGYSMIDGEKVPWKKGSCLHVQGPQTVHQHFNTSDVQSLMLRGAPGVRTRFFQELAKERFPRIWFEPSSGVPQIREDSGGGD
jgi:mannose-6-phosphate isomerase-like protein (cupin superfamily)